METVRKYAPLFAGFIVLAIGLYIAITAYLDYRESEDALKQNFTPLREENRELQKDH